MLKKYTFWLKSAAVFQLLTAAVHSISLFSNMQGQTETENQMIELMTNYKMEMGAGFTPSMMNIFTSVSACLTFLYLLGGLNNFYLIKKLSAFDLKNYLLINVLVFGACFAVNLFLTFLPPIILTGIVFLFLLISYLLTPSKAS